MMYHKIGALILISLFIFLVIEPAYANIDTLSWADDFSSYFLLDLADYRLKLPDEIKAFSNDARKKLYDIADLYSSEDLFNLSLPQSENELESINLKVKEDEEPDSIEFEPLPNVSVDADYDMMQEELKNELTTNINFVYQMDQRTLIRGGYGLQNIKSWDIEEIDLSGFDDTDEGEDSNNNINISDQELVFNKDQSQSSSIGISYKTGDKLTFSADYINNKVFENLTDISTILGVEYIIDKAKLRAKYQVDRADDGRQTTTGLEVDFKDQTTLSASYILFDPEKLENELIEESILDLGLDLSLNELSSVFVGYQLIDNQETELTEENKENKESNIKASFQIKF